MSTLVKKPEDITQFSAFFDRIKPLIGLKTEITEEQKKLLHYWLKEAKSHLNEHVFVRVALIPLLSTLKKLAYNQSVRQHLFDVWEKNPAFMQQLYVCSFNSLEHLNANKLALILNNFVRFTLDLPEEWLEEWNNHAVGKIKDFSSEGFYQTLYSLVKIQTVPDANFMKKWFQYSCKAKWTASPHEFFQLIWLLNSLEVKIDEDWLARWAKLAPVQFIKLSESGAGIGDLLHSADLLQIKALEHNETFIHLWFDKMVEVMSSLDDHQIKHILNEIVKTGCNIPHSWLEAFSIRMSKRFKRLSCREISNILYVLSCTQVDVKQVRIFLEKSRSFFNREKEGAFNLKRALCYREALIAQNYYKTKSFNLGIEENNFVNMMKLLKEEKRHILANKQEIFDHLCTTRTETIKQEEWIDIIVNRVDYMLPLEKKIIEIYSSNHFNGQELKQHVKLKHYLLEKEGYSILFFDSRIFGDDWRTYVDREVSLFLSN